MAKTAVDVSLVLTLPVTASTQAETIQVTNFTVDGSAVKHNFVDTTRVNQKYGTDGSSETFKNPNKAKFIEFTVVPLSEIDIKLSKFIFADSATGMVVSLKDRNMDYGLLSEDGYFDQTPDNDIQANPDYKTYRILVRTYIET